MIDTTIQRIGQGNDLSMDEMASVMDVVMRGEASARQIAALLTSLHKKGETVTEVAGAAAALRRHMEPIRSEHRNLVDTCGTGGDRSGTFNISTAAALVAAAAGVRVAKHGNRGVTSRSGSADVLAALGVNIEADITTVGRCLDEVGICFCFAPLMHPSMKHVAAVRRELGIPTIFNMLGPLSNPASAPYQLLGVGRPALRPLLANALRLLGTRRAAVVCGDDGLDEVSTAADTRLTLIEGPETRELSWCPEQFGVARSPLDTMTVDGPQASARLILEILDGAHGPARDIVVVNAAATLWVVGLHDTVDVSARAIEEAIDSGRANKLLRQLVEVSHSR